MAKKYKKNFLKQVLVRVDFHNKLESYENGILPGFEKEIQKTFPTRIKNQVKQQTFEVGPAQTSVHTVEQCLWTYFSEKKDKHARVEPTDFYIQYNKYESFNQLKKDFELVFDSLVKNYGELNITRIGLRYIDEIEMKNEKDVFDWKKYLNSKLYSALNLPSMKDRAFLSRAFSELQFNYDDDNLILKYGMFNPDYPSPIKRKVFTVDSDAYRRDKIEAESVFTILEQLHYRISYWFENRLIKDGLREIMDERR